MTSSPVIASASVTGGSAPSRRAAAAGRAPGGRGRGRGGGAGGGGGRARGGGRRRPGGRAGRGGRGPPPAAVGAVCGGRSRAAPRLSVAGCWCWAELGFRGGR